MHEVNIDASDSLSGDTPLCGAAGAGQNGSCIVLLRRGASLSEPNLKECRPLHMATRQGHWGVADTLLKGTLCFVYHYKGHFFLDDTCS